MKNQEDEFEEEDETVECFKCKGHGHIPTEFSVMLFDPCPKCQGEGEVDWTKNLIADYDSLKPDIVHKFFEKNIEIIKRRLILEAEKMDFRLEIASNLYHEDEDKSISGLSRRKKKR